MMEKVTIEPFKVIGVAIRTTNENAQSTKDIPALWNKFMTQGVVNKIPNKINASVFLIYTNYESDHTKPYDAVIGCKVKSLEKIPEGMIGQSFDGGTYCKIMAKGDLTKNVVYDAWSTIWNSDLDRMYSTDFEIYNEDINDITNAEVNIFVGIK